jgi:hypothetical protein
MAMKVIFVFSYQYKSMEGKYALRACSRIKSLTEATIPLLPSPPRRTQAHASLQR